MSSFLPAAENVARQRQNVRRDLKKKVEEESRAVKLALESYIVYFWFVLYRKNVSNRASEQGLMYTPGRCHRLRKANFLHQTLM